MKKAAWFCTVLLSVFVGVCVIPEFANYPVYAAEEVLPIEEQIEKIAKEQAGRLNALVSNSTYMKLYVHSSFYNSSEGAAMMSMDYTDPRKVDILVRSQEECQFADMLEMTEEERHELAHVARIELSFMPMQLLKIHQGVEWQLINETLTLYDAIELPDLNGVAYVIQLYDGEGSEHFPMLISTVVTTEYPSALIRTELVYDQDGDGMTMLTELIYLIGVYTGEVSVDDVVVREYRQK